MKNISDLFGITEVEERKETYDIDPLILSCVRKELFDKNITNHYHLGSSYLKESLEPRHRDQAEQIRSYYLGRFGIEILKKNRASSFRESAYRLLESRKRIDVTDRESGVYATLPFFYSEDLVYDRLAKEYNQEFLFASQTVPTLNLTYVEKTVGIQMKRKVVRYWFEQDRNLFRFDVDTSNSLIDFLNYRLHTNPKIKILSRIERVSHFRVNHYRLQNLKEVYA